MRFFPLKKKNNNTHIQQTICIAIVNEVDRTGIIGASWKPNEYKFCSMYGCWLTYFNFPAIRFNFLESSSPTVWTCYGSTKRKIYQPIQFNEHWKNVSMMLWCFNESLRHHSFSGLSGGIYESNYVTTYNPVSRLMCNKCVISTSKFAIFLAVENCTFIAVDGNLIERCVLPWSSMPPFHPRIVWTSAVWLALPLQINLEYIFICTLNTWLFLALCFC